MEKEIDERSRKSCGESNCFLGKNKK